MQVLYARCCGLDVHAKTVVACLRTPAADGTRQSVVRTFGTTTNALLELARWLTDAGCTHAAVESTGVYWQPVYNILEGRVEVILVNAEQVKAVPGHKTDVKDCEWIAQLLEHGLLRASFIPPRPIRELRELTRYRKRLIQERAREAARLHKVLESANIKLGTVATDILGASGRQMMKALIAGERDAQVLAELAKGALRLKRAALGDALTGRFTEHHAFLVQQVLAHVEYLDTAIAQCDARIEAHTRPFAGRIEQLCTIPGVARRSAEALLAEVGEDMTAFPTAPHLASWACVCPGNDVSAGKRRSGKTRRGNRWLRMTLIESAWAAARTRRTYLGAQYARLARKRGSKKAVVAVAHSLLVIVYHMLRDGTEYQELGVTHFDRLAQARLTRYHVRRLEELGHKVTIEPLPTAA
jgi:transposase